MATVDSRKLQPKLRMVRNATTTVNALRAEQSAALRVAGDEALSGLRQMRGVGARPIERHELGTVAMEAPEPASTEVVVDVFVELTSSRAETPECITDDNTRRSRVITAQVPLAKLDE